MMLIETCRQLIRLQMKLDKLLFLWEQKQSDGLYLNILITIEQINHTKDCLKEELDKNRLPPFIIRD